MLVGACAVALAIICVLGRPVSVVNAEGWHVPGSLLEHLRDGGIVKRQAVLNRVATTIQCPMQANTAIGMARDLLLLAMRFIHYGLEFFYGQRGLRYQMTLFIDPGAVRHIDLDPVRAVLQLLPRDLAQFYWTVTKLRALGHHNVWVVAFQGVAARDRDCAGHNQKPRAGNEAGIDRLFDSNVAVAFAFRFEV